MGTTGSVKKQFLAAYEAQEEIETREQYANDMRRAEEMAERFTGEFGSFAEPEARVDRELGPYIAVGDLRLRFEAEYYGQGWQVLQLCDLCGKAVWSNETTKGAEGIGGLIAHNNTGPHRCTVDPIVPEDPVVAQLARIADLLTYMHNDQSL